MQTIKTAFLEVGGYFLGVALALIFMPCAPFLWVISKVRRAWCEAIVRPRLNAIEKLTDWDM